MTSRTMNARPHWKILGMAALLLGAVACAPGASNDQVGASADVTLPEGWLVVEYGKPCGTTLNCKVGLKCVDDTSKSDHCGCDLDGPLSETGCYAPVVTGHVFWDKLPMLDAELVLRKQDPALPASADGVPVESYTVLETRTSNVFGDFGFWSSLEGGTNYIVSASLRTGEWVQTKPLTREELSKAPITLNVN